ncbi:MAG: hypothetical protein WC365_02970 [Candidatus Babeliales bacterium]|jgi:hypothetical protein
MKNLIVLAFVTAFMGNVHLFSIIPGVPGVATSGVYTSYEDTTANNDINTFHASVISAITTGTTQESIAALGDTFSNIITPLLTNVPYSLETLINAQNRIDNFISALTSLRTNMPSSDTRRSTITSQISKLTTQRSTLNKRLTDQQALSNTMITIRNLPIDTNFRTRIDKLRGLDINKNTLDALKASYLNDINDLLTYALSKGTQEQTEIRSLINGVMSKFKNQIYTTKDQQDQSPLFQQLEQLQANATQAAPTTTTPAAPIAPAISVTSMPITPIAPTPVVTPTIGAAPTPAPAAPTAITMPAPTPQLSLLQTKIEDIKKRTQLNEKLSLAKELLNMIKGETTRDDRQSVFNLFKDIESGFLKMTKADIETLLTFLKDNLKTNDFMVDFKGDIDGLITELAEAKEQAGDTGTFLNSLKTKIASFSADTSGALDAALYALKLLEQGKLPPEEQKLEQPGSAKPIAPTSTPPATPAPAPMLAPPPVALPAAA